MHFEAIVRDLSHKGLGVVDSPDGRIFFVRGVWPGDSGIFEINGDAQKYSEAKLVSLNTHSPDRVPIPCPYRGTLPGTCGGCPWMMASYESQLRFKTKRLKHALEKRKINVTEVLKDIIPSPKVFGYRNRIQLKTDGNKIGYVSEGTSVFAPVDDCLILNEKLHDLFHQIRSSLPREEFAPTDDYKWSYLDIDDELVPEKLQVNRRRPFKQGNTEQNEVMRSWIRSRLESIPRHYPVIDLFCGSGNFTEILSEMGFDNILAVEVQGSALDELTRKNLKGVRVLALDMREKGSWAKIARLQPHARVLLTDPPREGMDKRRGLFKYLDNLEEILYISCELDTFSRDTADIIRFFSLKELTPIDLFPHTPHLEMMAHFHREKVSKT